MSDTSYFFGYGANRSSDRLRQILGKEPQAGFGAIAEGFDLAIQTLDQIPKRAQDILRQAWGNEFKAYTLVPGKGMVTGVVWNLDEEDFKMLYAFEFIDLWSKFEVIKVKKFNGKLLEVITTRVLDNAPIAEICDGINYPNNLNGTFVGQVKNTTIQKNEDEYKVRQILKIKDELKHLSPQK